MLKSWSVIERRYIKQLINYGYENNTKFVMFLNKS